MRDRLALEMVIGLRRNTQPDWELGAWSFCVSGILLSLYFMYNVRRTARAESSG